MHPSGSRRCTAAFWQLMCCSGKTGQRPLWEWMPLSLRDHSESWLRFCTRSSHVELNLSCCQIAHLEWFLFFLPSSSLSLVAKTIQECGGCTRARPPTGVYRGDVSKGHKTCAQQRVWHQHAPQLAQLRTNNCENHYVNLTFGRDM